MTKQGLEVLIWSPDLEGWKAEISRSNGPPPGIGIVLHFQNEEKAQEFLDDLCPGTKLEDVPMVDE